MASRGVAAELVSVLGRLDALLQHAVVATDEAVGGRDPFRGLYLGEADAGRALAGEPGTTRFDTLEPDGDGSGLCARLDHVGRRFGLDGFERDLLVLALAPDLDLRYERLYGYLQDDVTRKRLTLDLALSLLCPDLDARLSRRHSIDEPARHHLLHVGDGPEPRLARPLTVDDAVVSYLLGSDALDGRLRGCATLDAAPPGPAESQPQAAVVHFAALDRTVRRRAATDHARRHGLGLLHLDVAAAADLRLDLAEATAVALLQGGLLDALVLVDAAAVDSVEQGTWRAVATCLDAARAPVAIGAGADHPLPRLLRTPPAVVAFPALGPIERRATWRHELAARDVVVDGDTVDDLADRFHLSGEEVAEAVRVACSAPVAPTAASLFAAARARARRDIGSLARRVEPRHDWDDIVLPAEALGRLRSVAERVRLRRRVLDDWGFGAKVSSGRGTTALFSGPSGTGKTMAAGILAAELGVDLYKVDLSAVVSKYIGETEKNLAQVFDRIEDGVLFFDEADALFGKRSEVRDAHDRYANIEVSFLLQRMEEYEGVAVLATNLRQNLDEAFVRRLAFTVGFPFPDREDRRRIWARVWPAEAPVGADVDLDVLAEHKLSGGSIRNVALAAAFAAAADRSVVTMAHLEAEVGREYEKSGKAAAPSVVVDVTT